MNEFVFGNGAGGPGPLILVVAAGLGLVLGLVALALLAWADRRAHWAGLLLGALGLLPLEYALEQTRRQAAPLRVAAGRAPGVSDVRAWSITGMVAFPLLFASAAAYLWRSRARLLHEEVPEHYREGVHHYYQKNYEAALMELTAGLKIEPAQADLLCMRGAVFARLGANEMALGDLDRALALAPQMLDAYLHRGRVRAARGEYDLALADFDHVLAVRHGDAAGLLERGLCLERKGRLPEAAAAFEKVLRMTNHPDFAVPATERLRALGANGPAWPQAAPSSSTP